MANNKTLILMRHGEAQNNDTRGSDRLRALTTKGLASATQVGALLQSKNWIPELILCSEAQRTKETCQAMIAGLPPKKTLPITYSDNLYLGGPDDIAAEMSQIPKTCQSLLVLGHNPGISKAVEFLSGAMCSLNPAGFAVMSSHTLTWEEAWDLPGQWQLTFSQY